ncbi:MAG TPA: PAS domain S-box protein [Ktedonobacteraceae bacterium]|jgi:PAS domain S-box-containing protein|nr:PAS domain S-box protein [Ktedonobacteraceae bacterium]
MSNEQPDRSSDLKQEAQTATTPRHSESTRNAELPVLTRVDGARLLEFSPDALLLINTGGTIVLINEQAAALFGYTQAELIDHPLEKLLPTRFHAAHVAHRLNYATTPLPRPMGVGLDLMGRRKDGSEFPVDISLRPILLEQVYHVMGAIRDITIQRFLERERAQQTERISQLTTLIDLAHDAIQVQDQLGRILFWNRGAQELYGWSAQEALGRMAHVLLQTHFPESSAAVNTELERVGRWEGELIQTDRQGRTMIVECRRVLIADEHNHHPAAIFVIARDITERRRQEQARATVHTETLAQRAFLQELLDALPGGVSVVHGHEARLLLTNRAAASIWGAPWPVGQPMRTFLEERHIRLVEASGHALRENGWATMRALLDGETVLQHQEVVRQPSGASLPVLVNAVPLISAHWQSLEVPDAQSHDLPGQKGIREPLALVIYQDVRLLKEAEYFKEEFIGITAHELRQPLAALKGAVGTLLLQTARGHGTPLAFWQQEMLQDLDLATDRLTDLTDDLLDVSRLQAGRLSLQRTTTDLVSLTERVVKRLQQTANRHQLECSTNQVRLEAQVDARRIEQVLTNLLTNAVKYSPLGGLIRVTLSTHVAEHVAEIQVQDSGMGIPAHQQARIFGRFMRADNAQSSGINGTGLGLYLCHALIEQHGGQLWFESTEGVGSTFFATLPLSPDFSSNGEAQTGPLSETVSAESVSEW